MKQGGMVSNYTTEQFKPQKDNCNESNVKNVLNRQFKEQAYRNVVVSDLTYVRVGLKWNYVCVLVDLFNREIIGYSAGEHKSAELVKQALGNAIGRSGVAEGLVFHSDRRSQYASRGYQKMLAEHGIKGSMSKPGCPYDNASMESFFATLKKERIYRREYVTMEEVKADMFRYIELFYNRKRLHSVLGCSVEYRLKYDGSKVA